MIYLFGILFAALVAMSTVAGCEHKKVTALTAQIAANKIEAKRLLDGKIAQNKVRETEDANRAIENQRDYDEKLKSLAAANRAYVGQLRDPGRRNGGSCPGGQAGPIAGIPENTATGSELSAEAGKFLRGEADRADIAATYAKKCRDDAMSPARAAYDRLTSKVKPVGK